MAVKCVAVLNCSLTECETKWVMKLVYFTLSGDVSFCYYVLCSVVSVMIVVIIRLVKAVEDVVDQLLETHNSVWLSSQNVAIRAHKVESRGFIGISCTAYADERDSYKSRQSDDFTCTDLKADATDDADETDVLAGDKVMISQSVNLLINRFHVLYLFEYQSRAIT